MTANAILLRIARSYGYWLGHTQSAKLPDTFDRAAARTHLNLLREFVWQVSRRFRRQLGSEIAAGMKYSAALYQPGGFYCMERRERRAKV